MNREQFNKYIAKKSIKELKDIEMHISNIINAKMQDEEMFDLLQAFNEMNLEPTLENKINFFLKQSNKLKAVKMVKEVKDIGLKDAKSIVDHFIQFDW